MKNIEPKKHYKEITFRENGTRLSMLTEFLDLVIRYFDNSTLNMINGHYTEEPEAREARGAINLILKRVYKMIRLADIKTAAVSSTSVVIGGNCQNIDLILNIFNLGRNEIPPYAAIDYIERAIDVYKSNRLPSFIRTINPFFWLTVLLNYISRRNRATSVR